MGESRAITGLDRLPWLDDEREPRRRASSGRRVVGIIALFLGIAALSYWLGTRSWSFFPPPDAVPRDEASVPIPLPDAEIRSEHEPVAEAEDEFEPTPSRASASSPRRSSQSAAPRRPSANATAKRVANEPEKEEDTRSSGLQDPWPARKVEGAGGRLVQVGTFSTRRQAKRGWNALMRINPSLQRLPALVVPVRSKRDNKVYYRLQMGTTSQAHSVALCQRLIMIGQSCIVLYEQVEKKAE